MKIVQEKFSLENHGIERDSLLFTSIRCVFNRNYSFKLTKRSIIKSTLCSLNAKCIFYLSVGFFWFDRPDIAQIVVSRSFNKALEIFLKLENSPLKISTSLSSPLRPSYCDVKSISFPAKASIAKEQSTPLDGPGFSFWRFWNLVYQIPGGRSRGAQMPCPRDREPEQMPRACQGEIDWCISDSVYIRLFHECMAWQKSDLAD